MLSRIPWLVQLIVLELLAIVCLGAGGLARLAAPAGSEPIGVRVFVQLALGLGGFWLILRQIWGPRLQAVSWSPVRNFGPVGLVFSNDPAATRTVVLSSHPSYVLLDLVAGALPGVLTWVSWGDDPAQNPAALLWRWSLGVWVAIPLARLAAWHLLGRGPELLRQAGGSERAASRLGWELAWQPVLAFWAIAAVVCVPGLFFGFRDAQRSEAATPGLDAARVAEIRAEPVRFRDARLRLRGRPVGPLQRWPAQAGKQASAGLCLATADGTEVVVFCDVHRLREFERLVSRPGATGELSFLVRVLENGGREVGTHYSKYYAWNPQAFGPDPSGRRLLTYFVDP